MRVLFLVAVWLIAITVGPPALHAEDAAARGYRLLRTMPFMPPDFDQAVFDRLWTSWSAPLKQQAREASTDKRRLMTLAYYGLMPDPDAEDPTRIPALGHVAVKNGGWVMNCLTCHAGRVDGHVILGLPNTHLDLQTLIEDVRRTKLTLLKPLAHLDIVSAKLPLSGSRGTTNAVAFGVVLAAYRDKDMSVHLDRGPPRIVHHDMDAPPLWNVRHKTAFYCDAFAPKNHRVLMQFMLLPSNGPKQLVSWEPAFRDILAWIESLRPPRYRGPIDRLLARSGQRVFLRHCADCHGTYGTPRRYPQRVIPLATIGTDPLRLQALSVEHRRWMKEGWLSRYGKDPVTVEPKGYLAPPLDGLWATAPYFHNGSVPTLWHVLHPDARPGTWSRKDDNYDHRRMGLSITAFDQLPATVSTARERRQYFDSTQPGKQVTGHRFPAKLTEDEKHAVLEYLKTL